MATILNATQWRRSRGSYPSAQAVVASLREQHIERDGRGCRFIQGVFGIFGHGNVAGMDEASEAEAAVHGSDAMRYLQARNEQGMVHAAVAFAKQTRRLRAFACAFRGIN